MLTTHVGGLPNLDSPGDEPDALRRSVQAVVQKQRAIGIDIINEGEYTKVATGCRSSRHDFEVSKSGHSRRTSCP
jgi:hypothetical protein